MKHSYSTTGAPYAPLLLQVLRWSQALQHWLPRLAPHFARPEPLHHALQYLQAVLSDLPRKNGWQIAEFARLQRPYAIQRLLSAAVWQQDRVRDALRTAVHHRLLPPSLPAAQSCEADALFPVLVVDESAFPKRGTHSAGVQRQYCGLTGRVENCQVGVFLSLVTALGHGLIDRELYLPEAWCQDAARREAAHLPPELAFQTKPELAQHLLERAFAAGVPCRWVVADTVYGHSTPLGTWLETQGYAYALAVPSIEVVCVQTPAGPLLSDVGFLADTVLGAHDWQRLSQSEGTKGERLFDWARLPLVQAGAVDARHWVVVRRPLDKPDELAYYLLWAPADTPLCTMVQVIGCRWHIEEDLQGAKALGLDHYEVRSYLGWYRHITLVLLAAAFLLDLCVQENHPPPPLPDPPPAPSLDLPPPAAPPLSRARISWKDRPAVDLPPPAVPPMIAWTTSEVRHLLARLIWPLPSSAPLVCQWSQWRRCHQYWASFFHRRRRAKAASADKQMVDAGMQGSFHRRRRAKAATVQRQ